MTEKQFDEIMNHVEQQVKSAGLNVKMITTPDGKMMRTQVPCGETDSALVDITALTTAAGTEVAQIYFTLTADLTENAAAELRKAFPALNFYTIIGSYGIYDGGQVYYKYAVPLSEVDDSELRASEILDAYAVAYEFLTQGYDIVMALADGKMDYETVRSKGLIPEF